MEIREIPNLISSKNFQLNIEKNYMNQNNNNKRENKENKRHNKIIRNITHIRNYYLIFLLIGKITQILDKNHFDFINLNDSFITLTIKGICYKSLFQPWGIRST